MIISEPSNPWVSGVSGLFTDEFYHRVRGYLTPNGVFGQWLHLYEINDGLVLSVLSAIHRNFSSYTVYLTSNDDMLIVASNLPEMPTPDWRIVSSPGIAADLAGVVPFTPRSLNALHLVDRRELAPLLDRFGSPNSDYRPVLDLGAERSRFKRETALGFGTIRVERFDPLAAMFGERRPFDDTPRTSVPEIWQLHSLTIGAALRNPSITIDADSAGGKDARDARQSRWELYSTMSTGAPAPDWKRWTLAALDVERNIHGGTAGVADESFYSTLASYMARAHAPDRARQSIAFRHALATWDFPSASALADSLAPAAMTYESWISADEIREGGMVAKLKLGDPIAARRLWVSLSTASSRPRDALRSLLLDAYLIDECEKTVACKKAARR